MKQLFYGLATTYGAIGVTNASRIEGANNKIGDLPNWLGFGNYTNLSGKNQDDLNALLSLYKEAAYCNQREYGRNTDSIPTRTADVLAQLSNAHGINANNLDDAITQLRVALPDYFPMNWQEYAEPLLNMVKDNKEWEAWTDDLAKIGYTALQRTTALSCNLGASKLGIFAAKKPDRIWDVSRQA